MIETIDNILQQEQLQSFKEVVESKWFPWNFLDNSAYPDDKELIKQSALNYSFYHTVFDKAKSYEALSPLYDITNLIGLILRDAVELDQDSISKIATSLRLSPSSN